MAVTEAPPGVRLNRLLGRVLASNRLTGGLVPVLRGVRRRRRSRAIYREYRDFTMLTEDLFHDNLMLCADQMPEPGIVIECGVWRGGMSAGMAALLGPRWVYYLLDSFEGLPGASLDKDGRHAAEWAGSTEPLGRLAAKLDVADGVMRSTGVPNYHLIKGWFKDTLATFTPGGPVAILRLDADWYDSTMECLRSLYSHVRPGGLIIIDDYYHWEGCTRALHDYLAQKDTPDRLRQTPHGVAYILKGT